jgi:hypothetical protein
LTGGEFPSLLLPAVTVKDAIVTVMSILVCEVIGSSSWQREQIRALKVIVN